MKSNNLPDTCKPNRIVNYHDLVEPQLIHKHQNNCHRINYEYPTDRTKLRFVDVEGSKCKETY